jgi:hypothetical protein
MNRTNTRKILDQISERFSRDKKYTSNFFSDYQFAKNELAAIGLEIDPEIYLTLKEGYKALNNPLLNTKAFDNQREVSKLKKGNKTKASIAKISILVGAVTSLMAGVAIYLVLKRNSRS